LRACGLVKFKNEHIRFPKISSPTVYRNLAPGHYAMWLQKENVKTEPVAQTIGGHGKGTGNRLASAGGTGRRSNRDYAVRKTSRSPERRGEVG
jgi:hypothetical protein